MATIRDIIEQADLRKPNGFTQKTKLLWIAQLDGKIAQNVLLMGVEELQQFDYKYPDDLDRQPLVSFPHDDLYDLWLEAQIDARNGEWNRYQNTIELYNAAYSNYVEWFANTYKPANGCAQHGWISNPSVPQYYITAYGLAVKAGYSGTLEMWLESLKGPKGDKGDPGAKLRIGTVSTLPAGSQASAQISGTNQDPVLDLGIPAGFYKGREKAGFVRMWAGETTPEGYLLCDGSAYSRTEYIELFAVIGTTYGEGDGETTFNVPNYAGRVPLGTGEGYALGETGGEKSHVLADTEYPSHRHTTSVALSGYDEWEGTTPKTYVTHDVSTHPYGGKDNVAWVPSTPTGLTGGIEIKDDAGNAVGYETAPHNNMQPYAAIQFIISTGKPTDIE